MQGEEGEEDEGEDLNECQATASPNSPLQVYGPRVIPALRYLPLTSLLSLHSSHSHSSHFTPLTQFGRESPVSMPCEEASVNSTIADPLRLVVFQVVHDHGMGSELHAIYLFEGGTPTVCREA